MSEDWTTSEYRYRWLTFGPFQSCYASSQESNAVVRRRFIVNNDVSEVAEIGSMTKNEVYSFGKRKTHGSFVFVQRADNNVAYVQGESRSLVQAVPKQFLRSIFLPL